MENEFDKIEKIIDQEEKMRNYGGPDKIVYAEDKRKEIEEEKKIRPAFIANTGIKALDDCLGSFKKGWLIVLSGPPKQGKTLFCQNITKKFIEQGHKTLWFSYELGYEELFEKFPMEKLDFYVPNYLQSGNLKWIEDKIVETKLKHGLDAVFIDHLDFLRDLELLKPGLDRNMSSYIGGLVQRVKSLAMQHNVVIFLMAHIRKNKWTTQDLPSSEELRDSGQIAQLADIVMMIKRARADKADDNVYLGNFATVGIIENRHNGKTVKVELELRDKEFIEIDKASLNEARVESGFKRFDGKM